MAAPTVVSATIAANGTTLTVVWSEAASQAGGPSVIIAGRLATLTSTYSSGTTTITLVYTIASTVYQSETPTLTGAAGVVTSTVGATANAAFSGQAITNNSTQTLAVACDGVASGMMVNKCMVLRETSAASASSGAETRTWAPVYYPACCAIQAAGASEGFAGQQENASASYNGYFPVSLALRASDRICTITGAGALGFSNKILDVVGAPSDHAGRGAYLWAPLREITGYE